MIATEPFLGVRPANEYLFVLFASPAGAYFLKGVKPVTVWISEDYVHAAPAAQVKPSARVTTPPVWWPRHKRRKKDVTK